MTNLVSTDAFLALRVRQLSATMEELLTLLHSDRKSIIGDEEWKEAYRQILERAKITLMDARHVLRKKEEEEQKASPPLVKGTYKCGHAGGWVSTYTAAEMKDYGCHECDPDVPRETIGGDNGESSYGKTEKTQVNKNFFQRR